MNGGAVPLLRSLAKLLARGTTSWSHWLALPVIDVKCTNGLWSGKYWPVMPWSAMSQAEGMSSMYALEPMPLAANSPTTVWSG